MSIIVLDTNVLIDHVHGHARWLDELLKQPDSYRFVVPTIVVAEYLTAQEHETREGKQVSAAYLQTFPIQDLEYGIAEVLGELLRKKTYPLGADLADLIVASTALFLGAQLATTNKRHFHGIPDLRFFSAS